MTGGKEFPKLAQSLYDLHSRFGKPDIISLLDGSIYSGWGASTARLDRHEEIPMDPELLYNLGRASWCSRKEYLNQHGYELTYEGSYGEIWTRVHDLAKTRKKPLRIRGIS